MKLFNTLLLLIIFLLFTCAIFSQSPFWQSSGFGGSTIYAVEADLIGSIYAGAKQTGLYRSTDNGNSWNAVSTGSTGDVKAIKVNSAGEIFASFDDVIRYSTNNGVGWQLTTTIYNGINQIESGAPGLIFAGHGGGLERSTNYGNSWEHLSVGDGPNTCIKYDLTGRLYASFYNSVANNSSLFRSTNNGNTWIGLTGIPSNAGIIRAITFFDNYIFVSTQLTGIYRSNDDGVSWTQINNGLTNLAVTECIIDEYGIIYAANYDGAFKSVDNGDNWINITLGLPSPPATTYTIDTDGYIHAGFSQLVGTYRSINPVGLTLYLDLPNGGENWIVGEQQNILWTSSFVEDIKIEYSTDDGSTWLEVIDSIPSVNGSYQWSIPNTPSTQCRVKVADLSHPTIYDESDGLFTISPAISPVLTVVMPNGGELYAPNDSITIEWVSQDINDIEIEYSSNNGASWNSIIASIPAITVTYNWTTPNISSAQCLIKICDVADSSFCDQSDATFTIAPIPEVTVTAPNGGEVWETGSTQNITWTSSNVIDVKIELSGNNGASWNTIVNSTASTGLYSWQVSGNSSFQCLIKISDVTNAGVFDLSDNVFSIQEPSSVEEYQLTGIPDEYKLYQNYPNPFNSRTIIYYGVPEESYVELKVYDLLGNEIANVLNGRKQAGYYNIEFELKNSQSGIYFYRLQAGNFVETKKMILLK